MTDQSAADGPMPESIDNPPTSTPPPAATVSPNDSVSNEPPKPATSENGDDFIGDADRWISSARAGSREALGQLMATCQRYLLLVANRELPMDLRSKGGASDIVQETFLDAQRDFGRFQGTSEQELLAWLRRLLLNNMSNFSRRYRDTSKRSVGREVSIESDDSQTPGQGLRLAASEQTPSEVMMADEEARSLLDALERLPPHYREVLVMRHREGLSYGEIADRLGRSAEAIRKLWSRAVERLSEELERGHETADET